MTPDPYDALRAGVERLSDAELRTHVEIFELAAGPLRILLAAEVLAVVRAELRRRIVEVLVLEEALADTTGQLLGDATEDVDDEIQTLVEVERAREELRDR